MPQENKDNPHILKSFIFGLIFICILIFVFSSIFISKISFFDSIDAKGKLPTPTAVKIPLTTYSDQSYSISYPQNYEFYENKIVSTGGFVDEQKNTIHLISPPFPDSSDNVSIILTYEKFTTFEEEASKSSTCPELDGLELDPITLGNNKFTHSGLINCGPNEVAFFYIINDEFIYEAKVETTADDYEKQALPEVLRILETIKFN